MRRGSPVTWEQVRAGVLILAGLALLSAAVFMVGDTGDVFGRRYRLVTLVGSAAGLVPGASVQLAGQTVGQVDHIDLIPPGDRPSSGEAVAVWMEVDEGVREQIRRDSRAQIRTQGLLGDRLIDIRPGTVDAPVLQPGDTVPSAASVDYDALIAEGAEAVGRLVDVTRDLSELTEGLLAGEGSLGRLVTDDQLYDRTVTLASRLDSLLAAATNPSSPVMRMLRDSTLYAALRSAAASLDTVAGQAARGEGTLGRLLTSDSLWTALHGSAARTDSLLGALLAGEGSAGRLLTDEGLYEEMLKTLVDLNALLSAVRENPEKYVPPVSVF
jgi:phospholipid/cholesterol/gamma-HCH transport system substrate-binding protein